MNSTRIIKIIVGVMVLLIGLNILLHQFGISQHGGIFPIILIIAGTILYRKNKSKSGKILLILGILLFIDSWLGFPIGKILGILIAGAFIYFGYRLIKKDGNRMHYKDTKAYNHISFDSQNQDNINQSNVVNKHSLIGSYLLNGSRWELTNLDIWQGIGEVKIDLSKASIPDGKSTIHISGWIGDIDIYIPYDLEVYVRADVSLGDIQVFGNKEGGISRTVISQTENYSSADKKVEIVVSLLVGDLDVTYI